MDINNYLFLEELLINRVKAEVTGLKTVKGIPELASVAEEAQIVPAVYIIYLGDEIAEGANQQGARMNTQLVTQHWAAVLATNPADTYKTGAIARRQAGQLIAHLLKVLTGWIPAQGCQPMRRAAGRVEGVYINGFYYLPFIFKTAFIFPQVK